MKLSNLGYETVMGHMYGHGPLTVVIPVYKVLPYFMIFATLPNCSSSAIKEKRVKILWIKKREYRDGIKSKETRLGCGEAHNVRKACIGITDGFKANLCT